MANEILNDYDMVIGSDFGTVIARDAETGIAHDKSARSAANKAIVAVRDMVIVLDKVEDEKSEIDCGLAFLEHRIRAVVEEVDKDTKKNSV